MRGWVTGMGGITGGAEEDERIWDCSATNMRTSR